MKKFISLLMALAMVFSLAACSGSSDNEESKQPDSQTSQPANNETPDDNNETPDNSGDSVNLITVDDGCGIDTTGVDLSGKTIGYVTISGAAPWGGRVGTELQRMAEQAGAKVNYLDAQTVADDVTNYCMQMIDAGVDALCVFGGTPAAMVDVAKACSEAGIGLFLCGLDVAEEGREYAVSCIGPDQEQMCYDIGQYVINDFGADAGCTVVQISGVPFLDDYIQREAGFARAMEETNYNVLAADYAFSSRPDAKSFMEAHLQAEGDKISLVMGYDDDLTMGAVAAIKEAGKTDSIKVYSLTGQNDAIQAVADGELVLTVMNRADDIAAETCVAMHEWFSTGSTEYFHRTNLTYITAENVNDWIGKGEF